MSEELTLSNLEVEILILENATRVAREAEQRTYTRMLAAVETWGQEQDTLDRLNRTLAAKRDELLARAH